MPLRRPLRHTLGRRPLPLFLLAISTSLVATTIGLPGVPAFETAAQASSCKATPAILSHNPAQAFPLPGGSNVRIWDQGTGKNRVRISVVTIPQGTLTPGVATSPTLTQAVPVAAMPGVTAKNTVAAINAQHFNPALPGMPEKDEVINGSIRTMATAGPLDPWTYGLAIYPDTKTIASASATLNATITSASGHATITGINWTALRPSGVTAYTSIWGKRAHPAGAITVAVVNDVVTRVIPAKNAAGRPAAKETWLTAPRGTSAATFLATLHPGDTARITSGFSGHVLDSKGATLAQPNLPTGWVGAGGYVVRANVNKGTCTARNETLRPRSAIAWKADGTVLLVTASNPSDGNSFMGGATVHQWSTYLMRLGAVNAINLDGGTSVALWVRRTAGGPLIRLDRANSGYQRPVVDAITWRA